MEGDSVGARCICKRVFSVMYSFVSVFVMFSRPSLSLVSFLKAIVALFSIARHRMMSI